MSYILTRAMKYGCIFRIAIFFLIFTVVFECSFIAVVTIGNVNFLFFKNLVTALMNSTSVTARQRVSLAVIIYKINGWITIAFQLIRIVIPNLSLSMYNPKMGLKLVRQNAKAQSIFLRLVHCCFFMGDDYPTSSNGDNLHACFTIFFIIGKVLLI